MYKELDTNKDGQVSLDEFISGVLEISNSQRKSSFKMFFDKIHTSITTKSRMILEKLKIIKEGLKGDNELVEHIEWYLSI
jgi:hypothetical protein